MFTAFTAMVTKILLLAALSCATATPALIRADLAGFPDNYRLYRDLSGTLALTTQHSGQFEVDTVTGYGLLTIRLELLGGPEVDSFGGVGATYAGSAKIRMEPAAAALLVGGYAYLPAQPFYWGGDPANEIPVEVDPFHTGQCMQLGPIGLGCATTMPMGAFYRTQGVTAFNYWTDWSLLDGEVVWSGDAVFRVGLRVGDPPGEQVPEPYSAGLVALGLAALGMKVLGCRRRSPRGRRVAN